MCAFVVLCAHVRMCICAVVHVHVSVYVNLDSVESEQEGEKGDRPALNRCVCHSEMLKYCFYLVTRLNILENCEKL